MATVSVENNTLVIKLPLSKGTPSKSGKNIVVATTGGNLKTATLVNGKPVTIGVNAYIPIA